MGLKDYPLSAAEGTTVTKKKIERGVFGRTRRRFNGNSPQLSLRQPSKLRAMGEIIRSAHCTRLMRMRNGMYVWRSMSHGVKVCLVACCAYTSPPNAALRLLSALILIHIYFHWIIRPFPRV
jgi:hypothetical protein